MQLIDVFDAAIRDAEHLRVLYSTILTTNHRAIRPEWANRFFKARLNTWPRQQGLWRSANANVLIVGTNVANVNHRQFQHESLAVLLRSSLVLYMAAVDKILHEALSKHFAILAKNESLDELVDISISRAYAIAQHARVHTGKGGKRKKRPGHALKVEMLADIYKDSYLKTSNLEKIWVACGKKQIFQLFSKAHCGQTAQQVKDRWSRLYQYRNRIAHECDMIRKARSQMVSFHPVDSISIMNDLDFIREMGRFISRQLG